PDAGKQIHLRLMVLSLVVFTTVTVVVLVLHAAAAIAAERERNTLETLLATALTNGEILGQKALGYLEAVSTLGVLLAVGLVLGVLDGVLSPAAAVWTATAVVGQVVFAVAAGMYCSLVCATTSRARLAALATVGAVTLLHALVYLAL